MDSRGAECGAFEKVVDSLLFRLIRLVGTVQLKGVAAATVYRMTQSAQYGVPTPERGNDTIASRMEIYKKVKIFRKGMLRVKDEGYRFSLLDQFPEGCCEFTSYLLAKYLIEKLDISQIKLLRAESRFKKKQRHVWLQVGNLDIDITANQFSSTNKTLFVEPNSEWHKRYSVFETENPDPSFDQFHEEHKFELLQDYENILKQIKVLTN